MPNEGSYVRWQSIAIDQLGYSVGLVLSFATASLGFAVALVKDQNYAPGCWGKAAMLASIASLITSIGLGLWCVINRLRDFRKTRGIARDREDLKRNHVSEDEIDGRLRERRVETRRLGERTWQLFWWQIGTLASGFAALTVAILITYRTKLF
ncbi:MAG: hypothetical protein ACHQIK_18225 [Candidatus Acidiferrales bacterium]